MSWYWKESFIFTKINVCKLNHFLVHFIKSCFYFQSQNYNVVHIVTVDLCMITQLLIKFFGGKEWKKRRTIRISELLLFWKFERKSCIEHPREWLCNSLLPNRSSFSRVSSGYLSMHSVKEVKSQFCKTFSLVWVEKFWFLWLLSCLFCRAS